MIKYLGIDILKELEKIVEQNFRKLKNEVKKKIEEYKKIGLSWFGRIALIKMKILPKINFLFRMIPSSLSEMILC